MSMIGSCCGPFRNCAMITRMCSVGDGGMFRRSTGIGLPSSKMIGSTLAVHFPRSVSRMRFVGLELGSRGKGRISSGFC